MTPTEIAVTLVAVFVSAVLWRIVIRLLIAPKLRAHRNRREAERFKTNPRVGDKAGYSLRHVGMDKTEWAIGTVTEVREMSNIERDPLTPQTLVAVEIPRVTAFGSEDYKVIGFPSEFSYFPPSTPLGIVTMDKTKEIDR